MKHRIEAESEDGLIVFHDAEAVHPALGRGVADVRRVFASEVRGGAFFFIDVDDAVAYRLDILVAEEVSGLPEHRFHSLAGAHLLWLPSGRLIAEGAERWAGDGSGGGEAIDLEPGDYALSILGEREFDGPAVQREYAAVVGEAELSFRDRIDRLGLVGCAATFIAGLMIALPWTRRWWLWALVVLALGWLPFHVLRSLPRYRSVEEGISDYEGSLPHYVVVLERVKEAGHLSGGQLRVC